MEADRRSAIESHFHFSMIIARIGKGDHLLVSRLVLFVTDVSSGSGIGSTPPRSEVRFPVSFTRDSLLLIIASHSHALSSKVRCKIQLD